MQILHEAINLPVIPQPGKYESKLQEWQDIISKSQNRQLINFGKEFLGNKKGQTLINLIFANSPYLTKIIFENPGFLKEVFEAGFDATFNLLISGLKNSYKSTGNSSPEFMSIIRHAKAKANLLIAIADILGVWNLEKVTGALSELATCIISETVNFILISYSNSGEVVIENIDDPGFNSGLIILALGKLGAGELNYSSDVDLIIFYDESKVRYKGKRSIQHFFNKFAQELTGILQERTKDGFVFRVDLRLRPDPGSTPPAVAVRTAEVYYESVGQNWERAAFIKARPVAGDIDAGRGFLEYLRPFIWRKNLDFASIEDIRSIKRQIAGKHRQEPSDLLGYNIKLGHGGIREIEFFVQTQQLIWGGREDELRCKSTCKALQALLRLGKISEQVCDAMTNAYVFYRTVEHRLQMQNDQQVHNLPSNAKDFQDFSLFTGFDNQQEFKNVLLSYLTTTQSHYDRLFDKSSSLASAAKGAEGSLVFTGTDHDPETLETLSKLGFKGTEKISDIIRGWHHGRIKITRSKKARELLTELTPVILTAFSKSVNPGTAFIKFDQFLAKLPDGTQIFSLFYSNPQLLDLIAEILGSYEYLARQMTHKPQLLEYVLSPEFYSNIPERKILRTRLRLRLNQARDFQDILDITRRWTHDRQFRVGVQMIKYKITPKEALLSLSNIADSALSVLYPEIEKDFINKYGRIKDSEFAVIAMGKLGGRELTFNSDLDLVFIYDVPNMDVVSDGKSKISASEYFLRLSRRFISAISSLTAEGRLYEIDIRLRPSGKDGPVAVSLESFQQYYKRSAWFWELMALTRARAVIGKRELVRKVKKTIADTLQQKRDMKELAYAVAEMREKIFQRYPSENFLDIKYVRGGLVDLEFIIQFLQLLYAHQHPKIIEGNSKSALKKLRNLKLIKNSQAKQLIDALKFFLTTQCILRLIAPKIPDEKEVNSGMRKELSEIIEKSYPDKKGYEEFKKMLVEHQRNVHKCFEEIISNFVIS